MGKYDGIYRLDITSLDQNFCAVMQEMGISEADCKLMMSPSNVHTWTFMENKDGSYTSSSTHATPELAHLNATWTAKFGDVTKHTKPFPCTATWSKKSETETTQRLEVDGKVIISEFCANNIGFTICTSVEGSAIKSKASYCKISPCINGYYEYECDTNMGELLKQIMPGFTADKWQGVVDGGIGLRVKENGDCITMVECFGSQRKTVVYKLDEAVDYCNEEFGIKDSRILTKVSPGCYKMVAKTKAGCVAEYEINVTEHGFNEKACCNGVEATITYRRCPDLEGGWKVVCKDGEAAYLDACGVPEPMKSEMMAAKDCVEIKRLGGGKMWSKSSSKFFPTELTIKEGEQFQFDMPGLGTITGIKTELCNSFMQAMRFGGKTINIKGKVSSDFIVEEIDVDGCAASRMKIILVRQ